MKHSKKGSRGPRLYFSHFQNRILCAFLLCTLIPIFIIGGISYAVSYNIAKDKILNASISADAQLHTQFDNRMQQVENIADTLQYNMYNLMQADAPMDTLAMLSEIRSNLSMFKTSFDLAYINIFLPDEHMASSESLYFFPVSKLSDFQIPKEVLENPGTSSVWFYQDLLSVPFLVNNSYHITNSVSCCRVLKHPGTDSIKYAYIIYLDASEFSSILQEIFQDNQITSYILTDNGKIVASNNPSLLSASLDEEKLDFLYNKGDSLKKRAHTNYHTTTLRNGWLQVTEIPDSYIIGYVERIIDLLTKEYQIHIAQIDKKELHAAIVKSICEYIQNTLPTVSVNDISEKFNYNPDYLNRLFKKEMKMNLSNYIQESRVHRAYDLLISTDLSVEAISHQAGYHNIGFFYQKFKQIYGATPHNIRKNSLG